MTQLNESGVRDRSAPLRASALTGSSPHARCAKCGQREGRRGLRLGTLVRLTGDGHAWVEVESAQPPYSLKCAETGPLDPGDLHTQLVVWERLRGGGLVLGKPLTPSSAG